MSNLPDTKTLSTNNVIEKSKDLIWANFKGWSPAELRLLEVYLSRINPREPDSDVVTFTMKEYGDFLGLSHLQYEQMKKVTEKLLSRNLSFERIDKRGRKSYTVMSVFDVSNADPDEETGQYTIHLKCGTTIKPLFFDIVDRKYIKYRLQNTINMKSQYSITLYSILLDNRGNPRGWSPTIEELRGQLGVTSDWYKSFRPFRQDILDPAVKEINEVSNLHVDYTKGLTGRKVTSIHFVVKLKSNDAEQVDAGKQAGKTPKKPPEIDYMQYIECMGAGAVTAGKRLKKDIPELFPEIPKEQIDNAVIDILKAVQKRIDSLEEYPRKNASGYAWSIMFGPKDANLTVEQRRNLLDDLIPWTYFSNGSYFPKGFIPKNL